MKYHLLIEESYPGLAEHSAPLANACIQSGHFDVTVAGPADKASALQEAYAPFMASAQGLAFTASADWDPTGPWDALFTTIPGSPGPVFRHTEGPVRVPRIGATHGLTDKANKFPAHFIGHPLGYCNVLFASGPGMYRGSWERYVARHPDTPSRLKCLPIGSIKSDLLLQYDMDRADWLREQQLDPTKPTVLYAPTWQAEASLEQQGPDIIAALAQLDANILVKLHHCSMDAPARHPGCADRTWDAILAELKQKYTNLKHVRGNSIPVFAAADLMVSDASGAAFEFMLQDRPVIFMDVPDFFRVHGTEGIGYWGRSGGETVHDPGELAGCVHRHLEQPDLQQADRRRLISELVYNRGHAIEQAVTTLLDLVEGRIPYPTWGPVMHRQHDILLETYIMTRLQQAACETPSIALYGKGKHTERLLALLQRAKRKGYTLPRITCILDDHAEDAEMLRDIPVLQPGQAHDQAFQAVLLSSDYFQDSMRQRCRDLFGEDMPTIDLYTSFDWLHPLSRPSADDTGSSASTAT